jgi:hypothetical protein
MSMKNSASIFRAQTHRNALGDPQILLDAKQKFSVTCVSALFVEFVPVPHERENSASMFHAPDASECST